MFLIATSRSSSIWQSRKTGGLPASSRCGSREPLTWSISSSPAPVASCARRVVADVGEVDAGESAVVAAATSTTGSRSKTLRPASQDWQPARERHNPAPRHTGRDALTPLHNRPPRRAAARGRTTGSSPSARPARRAARESRGRCLGSVIVVCSWATRWVIIGWLGPRRHAPHQSPCGLSVHPGAGQGDSAPRPRPAPSATRARLSGR